MEKVKVGIIGLGEVAQIIHLPILTSLNDRFEVRALCDISENVLQKIGEQYAITNLYMDAAELVKQEDLDAVFVLNSDEYHAECAIAAARNGKHVFIEKPACLTLDEAVAVIQARDEAGVQMMVGYMRRFAPAFISALNELPKLGSIRYVRIHDIIGQNRLIINQASVVHRPDDIPEGAIRDRQERGIRLVEEAIGNTSVELRNTYRLLCGLSSHDISAMRELIGIPERVVSAVQWRNGMYLNAIFEFNGFYAVLETGVDNQRRFDAHIEVYGEEKSIRVQYDTPYIRHLPTTLIVNETVGEAYNETIYRPTFKDAYTLELEAFHDAISNNSRPKTTIEDFCEDLIIFRMIIDALKDG
jgi:predicted dehydrogenase